MISNEERAEAAALFVEVVEAWGQAKRAVAPDLRPGHAPRRGSPEVGLSGTLLVALSARGYDLDVSGFVGTYTKKSGEKYEEPTTEVPALSPGEYHGFVRVTDGLFATLETVLRDLWNRATGHLKSQPRFAPPVARLHAEIEPAVAQHKARLVRYTRPDAKPTRSPDRPPYYVVVCEGQFYTAKSAGLDAKQQPVVTSRTVQAAGLRGISKAIMDLLTERYFEQFGQHYRIRKDTNITAARQAFLDLPPVAVTYNDLFELTRQGGRARKKGQALAELSLTSKLDEKSMATIRRQVARFNQFWRDQTNDEGTWLAPDPSAESGGVWMLQTMLFLPPLRQEV